MIITIRLNDNESILILEALRWYAQEKDLPLVNRRIADNLREQILKERIGY